ncbi:MAG TPA: prepilin-type N-terminal cleavage/methylation domain-containing protein [Synergistales bacterium]|nr:prepilin-type N-terminal cleavage/methylation domain-containing protein [Synergistales bacterium]
MTRGGKGFTLTELLITILIIGILSGSLFAVYGNARSKAVAARIVADLMTLRSASAVFFSERGRWPNENDYEDLLHYLGRDPVGEGLNEGSVAYGILCPDWSSSVFISARVGNGNGVAPGTREILEKEASSLGLLDEEGSPYSSASDIVMVILKKNEL